MKSTDARETLERQLQAHGLGRAARGLHQLSRPAVRLRPRPAEGGALPPGRSRIGGVPNLAEGVRWPTRGNTPLAFLGQLYLPDLRRFDRLHTLPGQGLLSFFYDLEAEPDGLDPGDRAGFRVLHHAGETRSLRPATPPRRAPEALPAAWVDLASEPTLPPEESHEAQVLDLKAEEWDRYYDLLTSLEGGAESSPSPRHKVLGYADLHQGDLRLDCQLVRAGFSVRDGAAFKDPRVQELDRGIGEWQLLLQLDHDPAHGLELTEESRLYFMIRLQDLKAGDFSKVWMVRQRPGY